MYRTPGVSAVGGLTRWLSHSFSNRVRAEVDDMAG